MKVRGAPERRFQHEILERIARQKKFGEDNQVRSRTRGLLSQTPCGFAVAFKIANDGISLRERELE